MHTLRIYSLYFAQFLKGRMIYKGDFIVSLIANVFTTIWGLLFILLLIDGKIIPSLKGWTRDEVLFIYGYSMISMAIFNSIAPNLYQFGDRFVIQGHFDRVLLRPLNSLCQVLFESFNLESVGSFLVGVLVIIFTTSKLGISFDVIDVFWLVLSCFSGALILLSVFVTLSSMSFHFEDRIGISPPVYSLIQFGRYPITIFNNVIQFILRWVVPFAFVAFYPATHFMNRKGFEFFCYFTPLMSIICILVASIFWKFGVSRYSSTGN